MSDWPELERRLLESARKRSRYRRRSWARFVLVPIAVTLAAVTLVTAVRSSSPSDERAAVPPVESAVATAGVGDDHRNSARPTAPGVHGTRLDAVSYDGTSLQPAVPNRLRYVEGRRFAVALTNEGVNDEFDLKVSVHIRPGDGDAMTIAQVLPTIAAGQQRTIELALDREPPIGRAVTVDVTVAKVPGEKSHDPQDDNRLTFPVLFTEP
jgi:hypothetical protein